MQLADRPLAPWLVAVAAAVLSVGVGAGCKNTCEKALDHVMGCMEDFCDGNEGHPTCRQIAERADQSPECDDEAAAQAEQLMGQSCDALTEAFTSYVSAAQAVEAPLNVRQMSTGAQYYFEAEHVTPMGELVSSQFPASAPRTPATVPCGEPTEPDASHWDHPTWQALNFALAEPYRFSYQFDSRGTGPDATFEALAFGDLDCDGQLSTYRRTGRVVDGSVVLGELETTDERE